MIYPRCICNYCFKKIEDVILACWVLHSQNSLAYLLSDCNKFVLLPDIFYISGTLQMVNIDHWAEQKQQCLTSAKKLRLQPNLSATPLRQWGFQQCLPFSWTTLKVKPHCHNGSCRYVGAFTYKLKGASYCTGCLEIFNDFESILVW